MSVLRNLEAKLEGLVEGAFSRAFRSQVQPVELARKLAKEMDAHKTASISRIYVPNQYTVFLSPQDRKKLEGYERSLEQELSGYLLEHARRELPHLVLGNADGGQAKRQVIQDGEVVEPDHRDVAEVAFVSHERPDAVAPPAEQPREPQRDLSMPSGDRHIHAPIIAPGAGGSVRHTN